MTGEDHDPTPQGSPAPDGGITVGVLEAGRPPADLAGRFDRYPVMVGRMLGPGFHIRAYDARAGELPKNATECDGWLVTGSSSGVYDGETWIAGLKRFVQAASGHAPIVGICFGHQLMAEAFGGTAAKSPKGWGIGRHRYAIARQTEWMDSDADVSLSVSHQDQVMSVGDGGEVVGGSAFTPLGILSYPARRAFSIQAHPEFEADYVQALIELRGGTSFGPEVAQAAVASLQGTSDSGRVATWLRRFFAYPPG